MGNKMMDEMKEELTERDEDIDIGKTVLNDVKKDWESSKRARLRIDTKIAQWMKIFNGDLYGNEVDNRSKIIMKDVRKAIAQMKPYITEPFLSQEQIVKANGASVESDANASFMSDVLNHQYNYEFDKYRFVNRLAEVLPKEGTVFVRTGWEFESKKEQKRIDGLDMQSAAIAMQSGQADGYEQNEDGTFSLIKNYDVTLKNRPTAKICKSESIYTDPTAESFEESKFIIHQYELSISDLRKQANIYDYEGGIEELAQQIQTKDFPDTALGVERYTKTQNTGIDHTFKFSNKNSQKVRILEYWGEGTLSENQDTNQQIVCAWVKDTNIILRLDKNPYPDNAIPFVSMPYIEEPFSIWGNALAFLIDDTQKVHTAIMRGFIDNMSLSNNGQKFFQKGSIDYINMKKMSQGSKYIEVNDINGFKDGSYNQIPQSTFGVYDMLTQQEESLTGVSRNLGGLEFGTVGRTASGVSSVMNSAQKQIVHTIRGVSDLYAKIMKKWAAYNQAFLDDEQAFKISGQLAQISREQIQGQFNVEIAMNIDGSNQGKIQQINALLQQSQQLGQSGIPPEVFRLLVAEIFDGFGKNEAAQKVRDFQPEPDPVQQQMQQLEMEEKKANIELVLAEAALKRSQANKAEADALLSDANANLADANANKAESEVDKNINEILNPRKTGV